MTAPDPGSSERIERVLVVSKTHLDVGFTDLAAVVRRRYLDEFFPAALAAAAELRARGGPERLRWTTGSWILAEALAAAGPTRRRELDAAIEAGDLCWHALPLTLHTEYLDRSLIEHGLTISAELDRRYGRRTRAAKVTDVPGHTRGLVSVLAEAGIDLLHVGVNPASSAPRVPLQFRWCDDAAVRPAGAATPEVLVMYQPGGYGAVQVVAGTGTAVAVDLTGDNLGPPTAAAVTESFARLADRFPDAQLRAATFDDVAALMQTAHASLPVLTAEIGDSWIHGVGTDPVKTAGFRALRRERVRWLDEGVVSAADPVLQEASTRLLLVGEHTWGLDQKTHWPDRTHWSRAELASVRDRPEVRRFEASWAEQRAYLDDYVGVLAAGGREDLAADARRALSSVAAVAPDLEGLRPVEPGEVVRVGGFEVGSDPSDGAVVHLVDPRGRSWASPTSPLGRWRLQTFADADFERWFATYNADVLPEDEGWARWDNTKPGLDRSEASSSWWSPSLRGRWHGRRGPDDVLVVELGFDTARTDPVAVPARAFLTVSAASTGAAPTGAAPTGAAPPGAGSGESQLRFELAWFDLPAARWPVAWWWHVDPLVTQPRDWRMEKLGEWVSPVEVVGDGGRGLHAADRLEHQDGIGVDLLDSPLVAPGRPRLLEWDDRPVDLDGGWHLCLYDNVWGTNFPMWMEGDAAVRLDLSIGLDQRDG